MFDTDPADDGQLEGKEWRKAFKFMKRFAGDGFNGGNAKSVRKTFDENDDKKMCQNEFRTWVCTELGLNCEAA